MKICTICARGGSKGVKNKNISIIKGQPLIAFTVKQALQSNQFKLVAVSSDSDEILEAARTAGAQLLIKRPDELASDTSSKLPAIQHAVRSAEEFLGMQADILVDLDCTSPLRNQDDILGALKMFENSAAPNLISGAPSRRSPYFNLVELQKDQTVKISKKSDTSFVRRQDVPKCFDVNASIYIWRRENLMSSQSVLCEGTILYEMPEERSLDIDSEFDFKIVEFLINGRDDL